MNLRSNKGGFVELIIVGGILLAFGIFWACDDFFTDSDHDGGRRVATSAPACPTPAPNPSAVPEPATWLLLLAGLGVVVAGKKALS